MNKFSSLIICLATVWALQLASSSPTINRHLLEDEEIDDGMSELPAAPSDEQETMLLDPSHNVFSSFCLSSRDHVLAEIKAASREYAATAMISVFKSAGDVAADSLLAQAQASEKLAGQIKNPEAPIQKAAGGDEFEEAIVEGQQKIQDDPTPIRSMLQGFYSTAKATKGRLMANALQRWSKLKETRNMRETIMNLVNIACQKVVIYESQLRDQFSSFLREVTARDAKYAPLQLEDVTCITSRRVLRANKLCAVFQMASGPMMSMLALKNA